MKDYKVVYEGAQAEIVEKKSRFIATTAPVETEEEALALIEKIKKQYWDARHNCFAYVIGEHYEGQRCSDDGEPSGTAGKPMLDVLLGQELHNTVVVVTRYFGGTLLGTGGLVRAYSKATQDGLAASTIITKQHGKKLKIQTDYTGLGKIQYILGEEGIPILESDYTDCVTLYPLVSDDDQEQIMAKITEGTNGKAVMDEVEECWFAKIDGEYMVL